MMYNSECRPLARSHGTVLRLYVWPGAGCSLSYSRKDLPVVLVVLENELRFSRLLSRA